MKLIKSCEPQEVLMMNLIKTVNLNVMKQSQTIRKHKESNSLFIFSSSNCNINDNNRSFCSCWAGKDEVYVFVNRQALITNMSSVQHEAR